MDQNSVLDTAKWSFGKGTTCRNAYRYVQYMVRLSRLGINSQDISVVGTLFYLKLKLSLCPSFALAKAPPSPKTINKITVKLNSVRERHARCPTTTSFENIRGNHGKKADSVRMSCIPSLTDKNRLQAGYITRIFRTFACRSLGKVK